MLLADLEEDNIARLYILNRAAVALNPTKAMRDDDGLSGRVSVPMGSSPRFECDYAAIGVSSSIWRKERVNADVPAEPIRRSDDRGGSAYPCDFHCVLSWSSWRTAFRIDIS